MGKSLHAQVSELAAMCFDDAACGVETDISAVAQQHGWTIAALVVGNNSPCEMNECQLLGYVTYNVEPALGGLYLARVAVVPEFRRRGHASRMVQWMLERARTEGYDSLWVHAVPELQTINLALGFAYINKADEARADDDASAWMVLRSRIPNGK